MSTNAINNAALNVMGGVSNVHPVGNFPKEASTISTVKETKKLEGAMGTFCNAIYDELQQSADNEDITYEDVTNYVLTNYSDNAEKLQQLFKDEI